MSKMRTPEIDVVRFSESDVIVASGFYKLSGADDNTANNLLFTKGNTTLFSNSKTNPVNNFEANGFSADPTFQYTNMWGDLVNNPISNLSKSDEQAETYVQIHMFDIDGDYKWNGNAFVRQ